MTEQIFETDNLIFEIMGWSGGEQTISLLRELERTGSINKAAQSLGIQYKSAWQKLDQINNLLPYSLVVKRTGGSGGGGSVLTKEGTRLLEQIKLLQREFSRFMQLFSKNPHEAFDTVNTLRRMEMKLSARNVWIGKVIQIDTGVVNSVVTLQLKGGDIISAMITDNSVKRLDMQLGGDSMAIVKASSVLLGRGIKPQTISARNIFTGTICNVAEGVVNDEITIDLPGGSTVTSIITSGSSRELGLSMGGEISAIIKASDVLLAAF